MIIPIESNKNKDLDIIILQGTIENIELINFEFDKEKIQLKFENYILFGTKVKEIYTLFEKIYDNDNNITHEIIKVIDYVYLFDKPPRYFINRKINLKNKK